MTIPDLLHARGLCLDTPGGRPLLRDLGISLALGDRVALVGRNGVGKSSLLRVLAGVALPDAGEVFCAGFRLCVPQQLQHRIADGAGRASPGEARRRLLQDAFDARPQLLLLDEPTHDLDQRAITWLLGQLRRFSGALLVASHDRRVLRTFSDFFVVSETGCRHFGGSFDALLADLKREDEREHSRYQRNLARLDQAERRSAADRQRRQRKKHLGRVREIARCPARALLNDKRSYAQEKQAKRRLLREARIESKRSSARAARRALSVQLPLEMVIPRLPGQPVAPVVTLERVAALAGDRVLLQDLDLCVTRQRLAITGPNGTGKTTLVEMLAGERSPDRGRAACDPRRTGYVAQHSANWRQPQSIVEHLLGAADGATPDTIAGMLGAHRFPLALAQRPLASLSPGERLRAALICLCRRRPVPELLILDEPTDHLDLPGQAALQDFLDAWRGALVIVSHDDDFLASVHMDARIELGLAGGRVSWMSPSGGH